MVGRARNAPPANLSIKESLILMRNARRGSGGRPISPTLVCRVATKDAVDGRSIDQPDPVVIISSGRKEAASRESRTVPSVELVATTKP